MPLGYYLGQGLIPLGYHSSDDEEGPCELPDGRTVCGLHGLVVCPRCCTDYSFMGSSDEDEEQNDEANSASESDLGAICPKLRRGTGRIIPQKFVPLAAGQPTTLFSKTASFGMFTR